ncbi:MAG: sulfatase-like hydrolase/transferase [Bacteroidales bacterium]|nr:sulfatase-like hydrolase/transferase [Bacteroidales bacterium]
MKLRTTPYSTIAATLCNLLLAYVVYMLSRVAYVWENWPLFSSSWEALKCSELLRGSLRFDSAAIFYTNSIYIFLMLLPLHLKERDWWHTMTKWIFVVINSLAVAINLCDAVYSQYTGRRTTSTFFSEFSNEGNLGAIFGTELLNHWYLVLIAILIIALLWFLYTKPQGKLCCNGSLLKYYIPQSVIFLIAFPVAIIAMRGGATRTTRPITISNANQYVNQPSEAAIVLNTPFTLIRTIGKTTFADPQYFDAETLETIYSPLHLGNGELRTENGERLMQQSPTLQPPISKNVGLKRNVVILIVESFGREYIGFYNDGRGYTPFVDSLLANSLTWQQTYANGRKSIDAMPSILSSIPMFVEPFFVTNYSLNKVSGIATELASEGYNSAFFHGADNNSMGFQAFARATGFEQYYGREEYCKDGRFDGNKDWDGSWAIWDDPFLQFYALTMNDIEQPFVTAIFTASSHHPFAIPKGTEARYPEGTLAIHKCIRYTDDALRHFFQTASQQPWFKNTIFILTSDHTNMSEYDQYRNAIGQFCAPILIYDPSGELPRGVMPGVAQQIDIMPTLLSILGHQRPFIAFGKDLLNTHPDSSWIVNYSNGIYQYLQNDTLIQFDGEHLSGAYKLSTDPLLKQPLSSHPAWHEKRLKAIIQQYMSRMVNDQLMIK